MAKLVYLKDVEKDTNTVLTVGTFDGVHAGHKALVETVIQQAKMLNARSAVVTFSPHPREIINPGQSGIKLLTTLEERCEILEEMGVDLLIVIPFDRDFSLFSSKDFVKQVLVDKIGLKKIVIGYDHHFGKDRSGGIDTIEQLSLELGFLYQVVSKKEMGDTTISSTKIRKILTDEGDIKKATQFLTREYTLSGMVSHGEERGRTLGFPTANLAARSAKKAVPKSGVYAVKVKADNEWFKGVMNIGKRPTFDGEIVTLEVHILDFNKTIYGEIIQVKFVDRLRDEMKFGSGEDLINQIKKDIEQALEIL